ncbi:hypothetical protein BG95_03525 [Thermosipho sp. 1063]|uniref:hypothetical protein n=1 Tax=unclassified Thermosipho (in: thermotogales) TaxID=2676525 RepID=UPI000949284F|nr:MULTISPECIES: hypothetical protein [unclassified Thermosipho (in: thermotogales)]ANQ54590.1 hypothetical protein Y592_03575 [Thermosipho sp. 1070]APT73014.1 hypothetical protein BG95_03525 [Thermosipho sp. 1063]OOC44392.1 hypothetical protein XO08_03485 [Thermosipho sp. 1074]
MKLSYDENKVIEIDNLEITPKSKVLIFRENGAEKTILLNIISGYLSLDNWTSEKSYKITILSRDWHSSSIFQIYSKVTLR